ncbi:Aspirochlorine biosynthesis protein N [Lachnellula suecica]|uniref:Aspirochlorine biosynthesis protein N n=1 Tax=Lachnellula suecica TaxID=602035 RepID=A0A8T9C3G8_9HELO|nr:Aspirochlorine biosynthesis protein N [Lachnellula suecica]
MEVSLTYLADLPLYKDEKPFYALLRPTEAFLARPPGEDWVPEHPLSNLEFEVHHNIPVHNLRGQEETFSAQKNGFEVLCHMSSLWQVLNTPSAIEAYKREVDELLYTKFNAVHTFTFEARRRRNEQFFSRVYSLGDPMLVEGPATGVHTDFTVDSGPRTIDTYLAEHEKLLYLGQPGYRFRIVNTWRSLVPVLEDNPLAVCDSRSVDMADLVPADRIIPTRAGEVYYGRYNPSQKWYWLDKMTPEEPYMMIMYDSHGRSDDARFCLHVSFQNSKAPSDAAQRSSIETRSIVITRLDS